MTTIYTLGYLKPSAERSLFELITLGVPIVDVRFSATSRHRKWTGQELLARKDMIYFWLADLGNELYLEGFNGRFDESNVKIHNLERGLQSLEQIVNEHGKAAIMCACSSWQRCHRSVVAKETEKRFGWKIPSTI